MGQKFFEDSTGTLTHAAGILTLSASRITLGGQQEAFSSLSYTIASLAATTKYNLFVVKSGSVLSLVPSTNAINVGPTGFNVFKFIRSFVTNASSTFGSFTAAISDPNPVGTIVHSMLTLAQFQSLYGSTWVLANGASASGTMYGAVTGSANLPDARGMALRGKNNGRSDGNQDPGGERSLGDFQDHAFGSHNHGITDNHRHRTSAMGTGFDLGQTAFNYAGLAGTGLTSGFPGGLTNAGPHDGAITVNSAGGNETRMRNIAVNVFIKVNME